MRNISNAVVKQFFQQDIMVNGVERLGQVNKDRKIYIAPVQGPHNPVNKLNCCSLSRVGLKEAMLAVVKQFIFGKVIINLIKYDSF